MSNNNRGIQCDTGYMRELDIISTGYIVQALRTDSREKKKHNSR